MVAAVLTPPDPVSQIGLALPTILLYEISILSARFIERSRAKAKAAEEEADSEADKTGMAGVVRAFRDVRNRVTGADTRLLSRTMIRGRG